MLMMPSARRQSGRQSDVRMLRRLLRYLRPYRGQVAIVLLLSALVTLEAVPAYLFHVAIDSAVVSV